jgi:hypothetical protein
MKRPPNICFLLFAFCCFLLFSCTDNGEIDKDVIFKDSKGRIYKRIHIFRNYNYTYDPPIPEQISIIFYDTLGRETEGIGMSRYHPHDAWDLSRTNLKRISTNDSIMFTYSLGIRKDSADWSVKPNTLKHMYVFEQHHVCPNFPIYEKEWPACDSMGVDSSKAKEYIWVDSIGKVIIKIVSDTSLKYP